MNYDWNDFGMHIPQIMLPEKEADFRKWAVVACDQYTSQPDYWKETEEIVGDAPSTLSLTLPEIYLGTDGESEKILQINENMKKYMQDGTLRTLEPGCMLVQREAEGRSRLGLVISVDLEAYDYHSGSQSLIRATEGTIIERIPPRLRIRENASLELPHIIILIDDPDHMVLEPLCDIAGEVVYDTDLMQEGGHIKGTFLPEEKLTGMKEALGKLMEQAEKRYGEGRVIFQAIGDGNHSLATAKVSWEQIKKNLSPEEIIDHPARFALCEIENIYDEGIVFEPIHRVLFGKEDLRGEEMIERLLLIMKEQNGDAVYTEAAACSNPGESAIRCICNENEGSISLKPPYSSKILTGILQNALDILVKENNLKIDYIHGSKTVEELAAHDGNLGFILPPIDKFDLFPAVAADGALPRKTFSMGEANEKRYYMEARKIIK